MYSTIINFTSHPNRPHGPWDVLSPGSSRVPPPDASYSIRYI